MWFYAMARRERMRMREEEYRKQRRDQFIGVGLAECGEIVAREMGVNLSSTDVSLESPEKPIEPPLEEDVGPRKTPNIKRKVFVEAGAQQEADFPAHLAHVRTSVRNVRDEFYLTVSKLSGHGFSLAECMWAVVEVANGLFGRQWSLPSPDSDTFDVNTLPEKRNIRSKLQLIEAETLSIGVQEITRAKEAGVCITAAIDSTTKRNVGQIACQGIHIGQNCPIPLPLIGISGESTQEVALQVDHGMEILAAVSGKTSKQVYQNVDLHLTDSVSHNKGINKELATLYDLDEMAGQIFCATHTTLGFSNAMNQRVKAIETDMKVDQIVGKFMVAMEWDSKNTSLCGQALDMCLKFVAPEFQHKMWNYFNTYSEFLKQNDVPQSLFAYKDQRL